MGACHPSPLMGEGYEDLAAERTSRSWMGVSKHAPPPASGGRGAGMKGRRWLHACASIQRTSRAMPSSTLTCGSQPMAARIFSRLRRSEALEVAFTAAASSA